MSRIAVVLFNLGGPDRPEAVQPFLFNLFRDPAIIGAPLPIRWALAQWISRRRAPIARKIYAQIGGRSPLLELTRAQATGLEALLNDGGDGVEAKVFVAMRYWHPLPEETVAAVRAWAPDRVVLLPLYPQFSTTTTGSSLEAWRRAAAKAGLSVPTAELCCYPTEPGLVAAVAEGVRAGVAQAGAGCRVLFSAHGLPKKIIAAGDPYQVQVEHTAAAVAVAAGLAPEDWVVCYQSRVGPLEWIGPSTDAEIQRAGAAGVALVVVPIAFVSEHSETLVELDIEYRHMAESCGVPAYVRVPAVGTAPAFLAGLAAMVRARLQGATGVACGLGGRLCPEAQGRCPNGGAGDGR